VVDTSGTVIDIQSNVAVLSVAELSDDQQPVHSALYGVCVCTWSVYPHLDVYTGSVLL
jgi:hypothetical protein